MTEGQEAVTSWCSALVLPFFLPFFAPEDTVSTAPRASASAAAPTAAPPPPPPSTDPSPAPARARNRNRNRNWSRNRNRNRNRNRRAASRPSVPGTRSGPRAGRPPSPGQVVAHGQRVHVHEGLALSVALVLPHPQPAVHHQRFPDRDRGREVGAQGAPGRHRVEAGAPVGPEVPLPVPAARGHREPETGHPARHRLPVLHRRRHVADERHGRVVHGPPLCPRDALRPGALPSSWWGEPEDPAGAWGKPRTSGQLPHPEG